MKKWIFSAAVSAAVSMQMAYGVSVVPVTTQVVQPQLRARQLVSIGTVMSQRTTYIQTEIAGRVVSLDKQIGDLVTPEMIVARINPEISSDTLTEAKAENVKARAFYNAQKKVVERVKRLVKAHATTLSVLEGEQAKLQSIKADVVASQAQLAKAQFALRHTNIKSTVIGSIQEKKVTVGSVIAAGDPVYLIADVSKLQAILPYPQDDRNLIKLGQEVKLYSPFSAQPIKGKVDNIKPMINVITRSFDVVVNFDNPHQLWHPGSSVKGVVTVNKKRVVFMVPETSIVDNASGNYIYVVRNQHAFAVKITAGNYHAEGIVEVLSGLKAGDRIVTKGGEFLEEGQPIKEV